MEEAAVMGRQRTGTSKQPASATSMAKDRAGAAGSAGRGPLIGGLLLVVALMALLSIASVTVLSSLRAYVSGESLYAKGQKEAVRALDRYIDSGSPNDHARFLTALAMPLGDREARIALDAPEFDYEAARLGFLRGGNHDDDIAGMVRLYRWFGTLPMVSDAIATWAEADEEVVRLEGMGRGVRELIARGPIPAELRAQMHTQLDNANFRLDVLEQRFSNRLGEVSRLVSGALISAVVLLAALITLIAAHFVERTLARLSASRSALRESNKRWELAATAGGLGVFEWDVDRDEFLLDARSLALCGWPGDSAVLSAAQLCSSMHPEDQRPLRDAARLAAAHGRTWIERYRVFAADGAMRHIEVSASMNHEVGASGGRMVGVIRDVTEHLQADRLRTDKAAAERANEAKTELLSRVSHELRTPLNAILGFAQLMAEDAREPLSAAQAERVGRVLDGGRHLLDLVNEVLDLSSLDQGNALLVIEPVDLQGLVDASLHLLAPLADARGIALSAKPAAEPLIAHCDRRRIEQVLLNLISNAIKYNRPNGSVEVELLCVDGATTIAVRDTGIGMTAQQLEHLFEPFNRLGSEHSGIEGAGLGLVLCRKLVELHGGRLRIDSRPREGTLAQVMLPRAAATPCDAPASCPAVNECTPERRPCVTDASVLYVEDNPVNVVLVQQLLQRWPQVRLHIAETGGAGIEMARARRPDLVLLDMQLPDMDGLAVLDALRADATTATLPVIMVSASAMAEQVDGALRRGASGYLTKPIDFEQFANEVGKQLRGR